MKRPSFQFYPSDWLRDTALRTCSVSARGLWMDMLCFMHEGNPYGTLKVGNKVILPSNLAVMVGATLPEVEGWLDELESAGVFDRGDDGSIMSRRMIRDESLRNKRAEGGKLGGNPALVKGKVKGKVNHKDNPEVGDGDNQIPTPSSSSSSSSSKKFIKPTLEEVTSYVETIGLPKSDGEHCFYKWDGNGWINGKNPIKNWKSTIISWRAAGYLPSQKETAKKSDNFTSSQLGI